MRWSLERSVLVSMEALLFKYMTIKVTRHVRESQIHLQKYGSIKRRSRRQHFVQVLAAFQSALAVLGYSVHHRGESVALQTDFAGQRFQLDAVVSNQLDVVQSFLFHSAVGFVVLAFSTELFQVVSELAEGMFEFFRFVTPKVSLFRFAG